MGMVLTDRFRRSHLFEAVGAAIPHRLPHKEATKAPQVSVLNAEPPQTHTPVLHKIWEIESRDVYNLGEREDRQTVQRVVYQDPAKSGWEPAKVLGFERAIVNNKTGGKRVTLFTRP